MFDFEAHQRSMSNPDAGLMVTFRYEAIQQKDGSYENVPYINIWMDKDSIVDRRVTDADKKRFKDRWEAFQEGEEPPETGTPINMIPFATKANIAACKAERIATAEQLVEVPDARLQRAYLQNFKYQVKDWIDSHEKVGLLKELRDTITKQEKLIRSLQEKLAEASVEEEQPKKRGRPRKNGNAATDDQ